MNIPIKIKTLMPDRTAYKSLSVLYEPQGVEVMINITEEEVVKHTELVNDVSVDYYTLTEQGAIELIGKLADINDKVDKLHLKTYNK